MTAAIFVLFAHDLLHLSDRWYGALIAIGAVGAVIGGLVAERLSKRMGALSIIYGTVVLWTLCMFAEGFWPRLWVSATATVVMAFGTTVWNTVTISLRQRIVPAASVGSRQQCLPLARVGFDLGRVGTWWRHRSRVRPTGAILLRGGVWRGSSRDDVLLHHGARYQRVAPAALGADRHALDR